MATKPTGRSRGRPTLPLSADPDRYEVAMVWAASWFYRSGRSRRISERGVAKLIAVAAHAHKQSAADGGKIKQAVVAKPYRTPAHVTTAGSAADANRILGKLTRLKGQLVRQPTQADMDCLAGLAGAYFAAAYMPSTYELAWGQAEAFCREVDEMEWFVHVLAPCLKRRFGRF